VSANEMRGKTWINAHKMIKSMRGDSRKERDRIRCSTQEKGTGSMVGYLSSVLGSLWVGRCDCGRIRLTCINLLRHFNGNQGRLLCFHGAMNIFNDRCWCSNLDVLWFSSIRFAGVYDNLSCLDRHT